MCWITHEKIIKIVRRKRITLQIFQIKSCYNLHKKENVVLEKLPVILSIQKISGMKKGKVIFYTCEENNLTIIV